MAIENIYMGLDLCAEYTQLSVYNEDSKEPESIYQLNTADTYMLPNVIFFSNKEERWYVGAEAAKHRFEEEGLLIEDVIKRIDATETIVINNCSYSYSELFLIMVKGHIDEYLNRYEGSGIGKLIITIYQYNHNLFEALKDLYNVLNVQEEVVEITSRMNSYIHYVFNQPSELYNNSVVLFDYSIDGLDYYRIDTIKKGGNSEIIDVIHKNFREEISYAMVFGDKEELDKKFADVAQKLLKETYVSSVYLTGIGFGDKWLKVSTNVICSGRRVFMGQNIYAKGACYAAVSGESTIEPNKYTVRTEETVLYDIGVSKDEDKISFVPIAFGGCEWYKMQGKLHVILDHTNRINIVYKNRISGKASKEIIEVHGLPKRPEKTTRLSLEVECYSNREGELIIKDLGFGKMYPTTNKIYRKEFVLEE